MEIISIFIPLSDKVFFFSAIPFPPLYLDHRGDNRFSFPLGDKGPFKAPAFLWAPLFFPAGVEPFDKENRADLFIFLIFCMEALSSARI